jgi:hypothetical protein
MAQETGEGKDANARCEVVLVGNVAEWIQNPSPTESKLTQALPELEKHCRLSKQQLDSIKADFLSKEEEVQMIAKTLAN